MAMIKTALFKSPNTFFSELIYQSAIQQHRLHPNISFGFYRIGLEKIAWIAIE
jgi:hypothetical protein